MTVPDSSAGRVVYDDHSFRPLLLAASGDLGILLGTCQIAGALALCAALLTAAPGRHA